MEESRKDGSRDIPDGWVEVFDQQIGAGKRKAHHPCLSALPGSWSLKLGAADILCVNIVCASCSAAGCRS